MKKTFKVVILPTKEKANFACGLQPNEVLKYCNSINALGIGKPQHLYITSDDEIKEGDWFIEGSKVHQCTNELWAKHGASFLNKKIVATTDDVLHTINKHLKGLPQLPESFIQAYIKAYNDGKPITEVDLEIVIGQGNEDGQTTSIKEHIKTRPDNTVIIHQSKMYSRDEVIKLVQSKIDEYGGSAEGDIEYNALFNFKEWIQDNLK